MPCGGCIQTSRNPCSVLPGNRYLRGMFADQICACLQSVNPLLDLFSHLCQCWLIILTVYEVLKCLSTFFLVWQQPILSSWWEL